MISATEAQIAAGVKAYNATPDIPHRHRHAVKNAIEAALQAQGAPVSGQFKPIPRVCYQCLEGDGVRLGDRALLPPYIVSPCVKHGVRQHGGAR